jgi:hypothetical protein
MTKSSGAPYKANEPRRQKIPKARYKVGNWAGYDAALRRRGGLDVFGVGEWHLEKHGGNLR